MELDVKHLFTEYYVGNYLPVTMLVHALGWFLFEHHEGGHHAINILLHLINGILVYQLGRRLFKHELISTLGAVIFLVHPIQIESVAWISELKNVLSCTFYLAGLISYTNYKESNLKKYFLLSFLFFVLACLSKSATVVFPLSLICIDVMKEQKLRFGFLWSKIPFLVLSIIFGLINIRAQSAGLFINHAHEFPYYQRVGFAGFALLKYALLFLLPLNLSVIYPYPEAVAPVFVTGFVMLAALAGTIVYLIKKKKWNAGAVIMFVICNLMLVLQFLPFGEALYADRYLYIPIIGLGWLAGMMILNLKIPARIMAVIFILFFSVFSFARIGNWKSAIILYEDMIKKYPDQFIALNSAGVESMFLNEDKKALDYLNRATTVAPRNYKGFYNRGLLYLKNNKPELAIKSFNQTLALYDYAKAYTGRASAYYLLGDFPKAIQDANRALQNDPNNARAHFIIGNCYNEMNRLDDAITEYNACIALDKNEADFYFKRAIVYGKQQNFQNCLSDLLVCTSIQPTYYEAYYWMGVARVNLKQNPCDDFKIAAQHNFEPAIKAFNNYCR